VDWSLLSCSRHGHVTFAPAEPELRDQLCAQLPAGEAWQCLRCGTFVSGEPAASGPAADAPVVPRGDEIRSKLILRLFAIERFVRAIIFAAAAIVLWKFRSSRNSVERAFNHDLPVLRSVFRQFGYDIDRSKLFGLVHHAFTLSRTSITLLAIGAALYAAVELAEGVGLWQARRWGEYFAMVATSAGLPVEIYELTNGITITTSVIFAVNLALVLYLVITKRLFGVRGGKAAYDARLRSESIMEAAARAAAGAPPATAAATP
jgi:uncharacterized membrane protein (DUF2068 family)